MEPVTAYRAYWHAESNTGKIFLKLESGGTVEIALDSPGELAALCDMLQHNASVAFDAKEKMLSTAWLQPGAM